MNLGVWRWKAAKRERLNHNWTTANRPWRLNNASIDADAEHQTAACNDSIRKAQQARRKAYYSRRPPALEAATRPNLRRSPAGVCNPAAPAGTPFSRIQTSNHPMPMQSRLRIFTRGASLRPSFLIQSVHVRKRSGLRPALPRARPKFQIPNPKYEF